MLNSQQQNLAIFYLQFDYKFGDLADYKDQKK